MGKIAFVFIVWTASIVIFILAERCRRNPETCQDAFVGNNGLTRSFVALRFRGRPEEARRAIVEDANLRREYLIERYLLSLTGLIIGIVWLFVG